MTDAIHSATLPIRNLEQALLATGGNARLANMLLRNMLEELPAQVTGIQAMIAAREWTPLRDLAHQIKGGAKLCGCIALIEAAKMLEQQALEGRTEDIEAAQRQVLAEVERITAWRNTSEV